jgi:hypothetical protein
VYTDPHSLQVCARLRQAGSPDPQDALALSPQNVPPWNLGKARVTGGRS